jgi:hypothetical protein
LNDAYFVAGGRVSVTTCLPLTTLKKTLTIDIAVLLNTHLEHDSRVLLGGQLGADRIAIAYSMR